MAKCPKCENETFEIKTHESKTYCFVQCKECQTAIGVLEDIDFKDSFKTMKEKINLVTDNQVGLDRLINTRTEEIKSKIQKELEKQDEKINYILSVAEKLNRRL